MWYASTDSLLSVNWLLKSSSLICFKDLSQVGTIYMSAFYHSATKCHVEGGLCCCIATVSNTAPYAGLKVAFAATSGATLVRHRGQTSHRSAIYIAAGNEIAIVMPVIMVGIVLISVDAYWTMSLHKLRPGGTRCVVFRCPSVLLTHW